MATNNYLYYALNGGQVLVVESGAPTGKAVELSIDLNAGLTGGEVRNQVMKILEYLGQNAPLPATTKSETA